MTHRPAVLFAFCLLLASCSRLRIATAPPAVPSAVLPLPGPAPVVENDRDDDKEREDESEEAARFFLLKRAPDQKNLPVERYLHAREAARRMRVYSSARRRFVTDDGRSGKRAAIQQSDTGGWAALGPGNIGGRTRALAIHPTNPAVMYAGSSGGGVWKTVDGGATWTPLSDLLPSIAVDTLAMDPNAPDTLYAGTGEPIGSVARRGAGIFKTLDGGATWNQLAGTANSDFFYVNQIVVSASNSNHIYAATETGVFASQDGGDTWKRSLNRSFPNSGCQDIVIRTDQSADYLFAACGRSNGAVSGIFRNTDAAGSGTWTQVLTAPGMGRSSLALAPSSQNRIYAMLSSVDPANPDFLNALLGFYRSDASGDPGSWTALVKNTDANRANISILSYPNNTFGDLCGGRRGNSTGQSYLDMALAVDPLNPDRVWAAGIDIFRSDDGGKNWGIAMFWESAAPQGAHADNHRLIFHPAYNGTDNQILYNTSDGGIYVTANANADLATGTRAGCAPFQTKVAWKSLNNTYSATEFHYGAPYPAGMWYWGGTQDNGTIRGSDVLGANRWTRVAGGDGGFVAVNPKDVNVIYHEFTALSLAKSVDGGQTFSTSTQGITEPGANFLFIPPFILDPGNPDRLYTGGQTLWRSNDAAVSWSEAGAAIPDSSGSISAIAVSPADSNRVLFGTSNGLIYRNPNALSADNSIAWDFVRPRSGYVAALTFDPGNPDMAYAVYSTFKGGAQNYVYKTTDGGATWTGMDGTGDTGLPDAPISSIVVDPLSSNIIYAGTDLGVFVSLDGGATWAREDAPFVDAPVVNLAIDRQAGVSSLFAVTTGRGVWRISLPDSGTPCQYALSLNKGSFVAYGGSMAVNVSTADGCTWVAVPAGAGFGAQSPAGGTGNGAIMLSAALNTGAARSGTVYIQDQAVAIAQSAALAAGGNDEAAGAQNIAVLPYVGVEDTRRLTANTTDPLQSCSQSAGFKTAWWKLIAPASGTLVLGVQGERYDTGGNSGVVLTVYDTPAADHEIACLQRQRDTSPWQMLTTKVPVTAGKTYLIEVSATGQTANDGGLTIVTAAMQ